MASLEVSTWFSNIKNKKFYIVFNINTEEIVKGMQLYKILFENC
jgi:hypothetical protein